jgi:molybdopterin converting factor subunit 1
MKATVLFFARAREVAGLESMEVELPGETACSSAVIEELKRRVPGLASVLTACVMALNQEYLDQGSNHEIKDGDEVAIIPPLSGG